MSTPGASPARVSLRTPAKVNLGLRLVGRRDDGYHLLRSVFAPIDLHDELSLERGGAEGAVDFSVEIARDAELPAALADVTAGPDNLVVRAVEAFRAAGGRRDGVRVALCKRIPTGGGLGGGSSDAGAVLMGLARLLPDGAPSPQVLAAHALELGADVPYFLSPAPALVSGIGERIEPLAGLPALDLVVANPGISVATAEVYRVADALPHSLTDPGAGSTMRAISRLRRETGEWAPALGELLVNDLEPAAIRLCPPIGRMLARLREVGAIGAGMSGSGGTVFGIFASSDAAERAARALRMREDMPDESDGSESSAHRIWVRVTRVLSSEASGRRRDPE